MASPQPAPDSRRPLLWILGLSTLLKLALLLPAAELRQRGDELPYLRGARSIAASGVPDYGVPDWDVAHWAPLYPYLLGGLQRVLGDDAFPHGVRVVQVLLSTATAFFVHELARRAFGRRVALGSAALAAFFPTFIGYTHLFLAETLFTTLFVAQACVLAAGGRELAPRHSFGAGLLAGLAALTRGVFVFQSVFVVAWIACAKQGGSRARAGAAGAFLAGLALVVAPWSTANTLRFGSFLLIDTDAGNVLHKNWNGIRQENHDLGLNERYREERAAALEQGLPFRRAVKREDVPDFVERNRLEVRRAAAFVLEHPGLYVRHCVVRAAELVNPTSFLVRALRLGDYRGGVPRLVEELVVLAVLASTMALLALGALGLVVRPLDLQRALSAACIAAVVAPGLLALSSSRYCFPLLPFLIPFAVDAALGLRGEAYRAGWKRWSAALVLLALLGWAWALYVPLSFLSA